MPSHESKPSLLVPVRVMPRASADELKREGDVLRVRVTAPPVDGAANAAVVALLARRLRLPKRAVSVERGASARDKLIAVQGLTSDEFWSRLDL